jgi:hypothetical protein
MTVTCANRTVANQVIAIFLRHGLRQGQGYFETGPHVGDPLIHLTTNIALSDDKFAEIRDEVSTIPRASIQ